MADSREKLMYDVTSFLPHPHFPIDNPPIFSQNSTMNIPIPKDKIEAFCRRWEIIEF